MEQSWVLPCLCLYGVAKDEKKALHYSELAAIKGDSTSRCNLGCKEYNAGWCDKAIKHRLISCQRGCYDSLDNIKQLFMDGAATKEDYEKALQSYQEYIDEIKSV
jgi:TPR repeat protein